jgi:sulfur carrier protein ThiS
MRIYLGGHLNFYHPQKDKWLEVKLEQPTRLAEILDSANIPTGEVYLAVVNDELVDMQKTIVSEQDDVKLFPPVGGGSVR